jgi:hypothetical protein
MDMETLSSKSLRNQDRHEGQSPQSAIPPADQQVWRVALSGPKQRRPATVDLDINPPSRSGLNIFGSSQRERAAMLPFVARRERWSVVERPFTFASSHMLKLEMARCSSIARHEL